MQNYGERGRGEETEEGQEGCCCSALQPRSSSNKNATPRPDHSGVKASLRRPLRILNIGTACWYRVKNCSAVAIVWPVTTNTFFEGESSPNKDFMYGTLSQFKLRHTRRGKAALRPLTKISRISIVERFLGLIFLLLGSSTFCTPKKHITDLTFVCS